MMAKWLVTMSMLTSHAHAFSWNPFATKAKAETAAPVAQKSAAELAKEDEIDAQVIDDLSMLTQSLDLEITDWCGSFFDRAKDARVRVQEIKGNRCYNASLSESDRASIKDSFVHKCRAETGAVYLNILAPVDKDKLMSSTHATFERLFDKNYGALFRGKCLNEQLTRNFGATPYDDRDVE